MKSRCPRFLAAGIAIFVTTLGAQSQITPQNALAIAAHADFQIRLTWPGSVGRATLEYSESIGSSAQWLPVQVVPVLAGDTQVVILDLTEEERFFRLRLDASPGMRVWLANDTGVDRTDRVTSDPGLFGAIPNRSALVRFRVSAGSTARSVDILNSIGADGGFYLDSERLDEIAGAPLTDGPQMIRFEAESPGGVVNAFEVRLTLDTTAPEARSSPSAGATGVLANELIEAAFTEPVFPGSVGFDGIFRAADASRIIALEHLGSPIPGTAYFDATGARLGFVPSRPLEPGTTYTWTVRPELLTDRAGNPARIAPSRSSFRTAGGLGLPNTSVAGRVFDSVPGANGVNIPLVGARATLVSDRSRMAVTDASGRFQIDNVPSGRLMVEVDGRTVATAPGTFYPTVTELIDIVPGRTNTFPAAIFLPLARESDYAVINNAAGAVTTVGNSAQLPGWQLQVPGGAVQRRDGTMAGRILIAPVPPDRLPAPLPPAFNPSVVITIQSEDGADVFAQPVPLTAPNLEGLPPGSKTVLWDFDHARGDFIPAATMTVSADGKTVSTDPGQGVVRPGWHLVGRLILGRIRASDTVDHKNNGQELTPQQREELAKLLNEAIRKLEKTAVDALSAVPIPGVGGILSNYGLNGLGNAIDSMGDGANPGGNPQDGLSQLAQVAGDVGLDALNASALSALAAAAVQQGLKIDAQQIRDALNGNESAVKGLRDAVAGKNNARRLMSELGKLGKAASALNSLASAAAALAEWRQLVDLIERINKLLEDPPGDDASRFLASSANLIATAIDGAADALEATLRAGDAVLLGAQIASVTHEWPATSAALAPSVRNEVLRIAEVYDANAATLANAENRMRSTFPRALTALTSLKELVNPSPDERVFYKVAMTDGTVIRGSAAGGDWFPVRFTLGLGSLSANVTAATVDASRIGFSTLSVPSSPPANGVFEAPIVFLHAAKGPDTDGNGVSDTIDDVISSSPVSRSQASDLRSGVSPEAAGLDLSGPVSRLGLPSGGATDLAIHESQVYAMLSSLGFFTIDYSDLMRPAFVGNLVVVERIQRITTGARHLATASAHGQVRLYNLDEPSRPREVFTLNRDATSLAPALIAGGWFVIQNAGTLEVYSLRGGPVVDSRLLPGTGRVVDLSYTAGNLFALRAGPTPSLVSIELAATGRLSTPNALVLPILVPETAAPRLSGGTGTLLISGVSNATATSRGVLSVDIRDPRAMKTGTFDHPNAVSAGIDGAGNRIIVAAGQTSSELAIYRDNSLATPTRRIPLANVPGPILVHNGHVVLASPPAQSFTTAATIDAIRLPDSDRAGVPPTVSFVLPADGFEIVEKRAFAASILAVDDVRMARVELLLQGNNQVAVDSVPPFDLAFLPPSGLPETAMTLTARAYDTAGNVREATITGRYQPTAAQVVGTTPSPGSSTVEDLDVVRLTFDKPLARTTLPPSAGFRLAAAGPDRALGTTDDVLYPVLGRSFEDEGFALGISFGVQLPPDRYRLTITDGTLRDIGGLSLDGETSAGLPSGNGNPGGEFSLEFATVPVPRAEVHAFPFRILGGASVASENTGIQSSPFVLDDFNRDGRDDIAVAHSDPASNSARLNRVDVLLQNSNGTFGTPIRHAVGREPVLLASGDINGDGFADLVSLNWEVDEANFNERQRQPFGFSILLGLADGTFDAARTIESGRTMGSLGVLRLADFNRDGLDDIALLVPDFHGIGFDNKNPDPAEVLIYLATGGGAFAAPREMSIPYPPTSSAERVWLVPGDFNGDRNVDLIVNGFGFLTGSEDTQGRVYLGRGDGTFDERVSPPFGQRGREWRLEVADLDRDGRDDAIYGNKVYRSLGDGDFVEITNAIPGSLDRGSFRPFGIGELNGDGIADLVGPPTFADGGGFLVLHGIGNGTFRLADRFLTNGPTRLGQLAMVDLTGDGRDDLLLFPESLSDGESMIDEFTMIASANGSFPPLMFVAGASDIQLRGIAPSEGKGITTADFNGDGRADIVGVFRRAPVAGAIGWIGMIPSAPGGGFSARRQFAPPPGVFHQVQWPGDADGDGKLDLVVSDQIHPGRIHYYPGDGAGGLGTPVEIDGGGLLHGFADLDGDQRPDLITSTTRFGGTTAGTYLAIRRNLGGGNFAPAVEFRIGGVPRVVLVAAFDDDGRPDLAIDAANATTIALQRDGLRFEAAGSTGFRTPSMKLVAADDFDGDGRRDLLTMTPSFTDAQFQLWPGAGGGRLTTPHPLQPTMLAGTEAVHVSDVNGDGFLDLVGRNFSAEAEARIAFGDGRGRFSRAIRFAGFQDQTNGGDSVLYADFTGDGIPDLLISGLLLPHR